MRVLIIGYLGHVGSWLRRRISKYHHVQCLDVKPKKIKPPTDVMHITFPYSPAFVKHVVDYIQKYSPTLVLIESTVPPGTTVNVWREYASRTYMPPPLPFHLCHSPIRGTSWNWWKFTKMIGPVDKESGEAAEKYYQSLRLKTLILHSPLETELGKLLENNAYSLMIAWTQEVNRICKHFQAEFNDAYLEFARTFTFDYLYTTPRPLFFPGLIEGKCLPENLKILGTCYPSPWLDVILKSNKQRIRELKDPKEKKALTAIIEKVRSHIG